MQFTSRREFIHVLACGMSSCFLPPSILAAGGFPPGATPYPTRSFPTPTNINHLSCAVRDYAESRDFYVGLFGMRVGWDNGKQCALEFGNPMAPNGLYIRPVTRATDKPEIGHIAYGVPDFMKYKSAIKSEMERYQLAQIRPDGELGWICNDPAGYMLNIVVEKDKAMFPGAAEPCDVAGSQKCREAYQEGVKNIGSASKTTKRGFTAQYFSNVVLNVPESRFPTEAEFYRDMMGMKEIYSATGTSPIAFLRFGQNTLYLQKTPSPNDKPFCTHFGLVIDNYESRKVEAELRRWGLAPKPNSRLALTVTDPNGFLLEVAGPGLPEHIANDCNGTSATCPGGVRG